MNVLSLFDGISCGHIALERAGIKVDKYYASEIKEDGIKVTQYNYPETIQIGDVTKVSYNKGILYTEKGSYKVGKIDLLIGGSPCQDLSQANKERKGLNGTKSSLFYEYVRLLNEVKPKYFLLENVRMTEDNFNLINSLLCCEPININSKLLSAQLRNRYYWTNIPGVTIPEDKNILLQDILEYGYTNRKKARCLLESDSRPLKNEEKMIHRYIDTGFTTLIFKDEQHYIDCINGKIDKYKGIRYLNQLELERLQTLPEGYTKILSRNKAAGVIGDGWTVDVIAHIFKNIK